MTTYRLTLNEEQARIVTRACELIARCNMPQDSNGAESTQIAEDIIRYVGYHGSHANSDEIRKAFMHMLDCYRVNHSNAWDIYQVVRHRLAWDRLEPGEKPGCTVDFHEPLRMGNQILATIEHVKEEPKKKSKGAKHATD
jgi:hypothetical protein